MRLGGVDQSVLIRGWRRDAPLLLFLHGGPGMPMMYLAHRFQRPLEKDFLVVQWDRRGAGKSYRPDLSPRGMSVEQELSDARELIGILARRFGKDRVYLVGHSYGTYLGMLLAARSPRLLCAYVGVGQVTDPRREEAVQDEFLRRRARELGRAEALDELSRDPRGSREKWLFRFGGELVGASSFLPLLRIGLAAPEYTISDVLRVRRGVQFTQRHLRYDAIRAPLSEAIRSVEVSVFFFAGRHDYTTPSVLAEEYLRGLAAPKKELVWFERSAHFAFLEEPEKFAREMRDRVLRRDCGGSEAPVRHAAEAVRHPPAPGRHPGR